VIGFAGDHAAFLSSAGKVTTFDGSFGPPRAINDRGQVVGTSGGAAYLYSEGKLVNLNMLLPPESHWKLSDAAGINNKGQIVGMGANPEGHLHAFLLTPTAEAPEPSSLALLGLGALGLAGRCWRRRAAGPKPVIRRSAPCKAAAPAPGRAP
jgi:probable HAF family extracellular repeat protein